MQAKEGKVNMEELTVEQALEGSSGRTPEGTINSLISLSKETGLISPTEVVFIIVGVMRVSLESWVKEKKELNEMLLHLAVRWFNNGCIPKEDI